MAGLVRLKYMEYEGGTVGMLLSHALWQKNKECEWCALLLLFVHVCEGVAVEGMGVRWDFFWMKTKHVIHWNYIIHEELKMAS